MEELRVEKLCVEGPSIEEPTTEKLRTEELDIEGNWHGGRLRILRGLGRMVAMAVALWLICPLAGRAGAPSVEVQEGLELSARSQPSVIETVEIQPTEPKTRIASAGQTEPGSSKARRSMLTAGNGSMKEVLAMEGAIEAVSTEAIPTETTAPKTATTETAPPETALTETTPPETSPVETTAQPTELQEGAVEAPGTTPSEPSWVVGSDTGEDIVYDETGDALLIGVASGEDLQEGAP